MSGKRSEATALVTGGASGLGLAIATRLRADGARVAISDIDPDRGEQVAADGGFAFIRQDVSEEADWTRAIEEVEAALGTLTILVNNAGILGPVALDPVTTSFADWRKVLSVNLDGVFLGCRAAIPAIARAGGGAIVNMSSIGGLIATPHVTAYGVSKAGVRHLTKSVAQYCAQEKLNIRCNSVHPGFVWTSLWERAGEERGRITGVHVPVEDQIADAGGRVPLGGMTLPEDIAGAVAFLCGPDSRHITGVQLLVDGGVYECETFRAD